MDGALRRRAAGYQAFYEAMPIRRTRLDTRLQMPIHRRVRYGKLAEALRDAGGMGGAIGGSLASGGGGTGSAPAKVAVKASPRA